MVDHSRGLGASYDLGYSDDHGKKISETHVEGILLGLVCQGALGCCRATEVYGRQLVEGKAMTDVTDKQVEEFGIEITPLRLL